MVFLMPQAVRHFVEHRVTEERIKCNVLALVLGNQHLGNRNQNLVELGQHRVFELQAARSLGELDFLVIGQVDCNGLGAGIAVSRVEHHVVGIQIGIRPRGFRLVFIRDRQAGL